MFGPVPEGLVVGRGVCKLTLGDYYLPTVTMLSKSFSYEDIDDERKDTIRIPADPSGRPGSIPIVTQYLRRQSRLTKYSKTHGNDNKESSENSIVVEDKVVSGVAPTSSIGSESSEGTHGK